jgi:hypothetical protein
VSAKKAATSIRVNLRFGPRTDPALIREIAAMPPYRRAKRVRQLLQAGWQARHDLGPSPGRAPARRSRSLTTTEPSDADFSEDLLALVGRSVRL